MKHQEINKITKLILNNESLINSPGLYNGKAGIALTLFETSKALRSSKLEDNAFKLLQEAIIISKDDISFENGLSGIGYTILYLLKNSFIETDFMDIYENQYGKILSQLNNIEKKPENILNNMRLIYFLYEAKQIFPTDLNLANIIQKLFDGVELFLLVQFHDIPNPFYTRNKNNVISIFELYLRLLIYSEYLLYSRTILEKYCQLYITNKITGTFKIGQLLNEIALREKNIQLNIIASDIYKSMKKQINYEVLNLREQLDVIQILKKKNESNANEKLPISFFDNSTQNCIVIKQLTEIVGPNNSIFGYGYGLSRLLMFYVNKNHTIL